MGRVVWEVLKTTHPGRGRKQDTTGFCGRNLKVGWGGGECLSGRGRTRPKLARRPKLVGELESQSEVNEHLTLDRSGCLCTVNLG